MGNKEMILIIDDEINIQLTLSRILTRAGFQVMTLMNDQESIMKALTNNIDLIIIDFDVEVNKGECSLSEIRNKLIDIPLIVLTHHPSEEIYNCSHKFEHCELIIKPINPETILEVVIRMLAITGNPKPQPHLINTIS